MSYRSSGYWTPGGPQPPAGPSPTVPAAAMTVEVDDHAMQIIKRLGISDEDVERCKTAFSHADADGSGSVDFDELCNLLASLSGKPLSPEETESLEQRFKCSSGVLDFGEFLEAFTSTTHYASTHLEQMIRSLGNHTRKQLHNNLQDTNHVIRFQGVPVHDIRSYIDEELAQRDACLSLPWVVILFISFLCSVILHQRYDVINAQRRALIFDLEENANFAFAEPIPFESPRMGHKNLYDVNTFADIWSWLNLGLTPLLWDEGWSMSEHRSSILARCASKRSSLEGYFGSNVLPLKDVGTDAVFNRSCPEQEINPDIIKKWYGQPRTPTYLWFNTVVGGVRMRQSIATQIECPASKSYASKLHSGVCIKPRQVWLKPESWLNLFDSAAYTDMDTFFLLSGSPQAEIRKKLRDLENKAWLNPMSQDIEFLFIVYNAHIDLLVVTQISIHVNGAGHFYRTILPTGIWLNPYHGWECYLADTCWVLGILKILISEMMDFNRLFNKRGLRNACAEYFSISNFVDWCSTLAGISISIFWALHMSKLANLRDYLDQAEIGVPGTWSDSSLREQFFDQAHAVAASMAVNARFVSVYPFILVSRVFKVCSGQPRLGLVTQTLVRAYVEVVHFGLVFAFVFTLFASSAMILFGPHNPEFASFDRAIDTSFHILMGDVDWDSLNEAGRLPCGIWFWSFIWILDLVMFNMMLAIIMDVYTETRGNLRSDAETLWSQAYQVYWRYKEMKAGRRLGLAKILRHLEDLQEQTSPRQGPPESEVLTAQQFVKHVPGLGEAQAARILAKSWQHKRSDESSGKSFTDAIGEIHTVAHQVAGVQESLESLLRMSDLTASLTAHMAVPPQDAKNGSLEPAQMVEALHKQQAMNQKPLEDLITLQRQQAEILARLEARFEQVDARVDRVDRQMQARTHEMPSSGAGFCRAPPRVPPTSSIQR